MSETVEQTRQHEQHVRNLAAVWAAERRGFERRIGRLDALLDDWERTVESAPRVDPHDLQTWLAAALDRLRQRRRERKR